MLKEKNGRSGTYIFQVLRVHRQYPTLSYRGNYTGTHPTRKTPVVLEIVTFRVLFVCLPCLRGFPCVFTTIHPYEDKNEEPEPGYVIRVITVS